MSRPQGQLGPSGVPRRLLALDGGGIRGLVTLEVLARMEADLRARRDRPDLVLADVFDYVGGTSTGAVIATGLALGWSVDRLLDLYQSFGQEMFAPARLRDRWRHSYDHGPLASRLQAEVGPDTTLGSDALRTLLLVVLRNASTDSPWPVSSNPSARFNDRALPDCNLDIPLWQLVRASTAAPTFFAPETVALGGEEAVFVDGGLTPFNNPALQLVTMATHEAYRLCWPTGPDRLLLVSVGTGRRPARGAHAAPAGSHLVDQVAVTLNALMGATAVQQDVLCRMLGRCRFGEPIDAELGGLAPARTGLAPSLFSYVRYDADLSPAGLAALGLGDLDAEAIGRLDAVDHMAELRAVGRAVAARDVDVSHLDGFV